MATSSVLHCSSTTTPFADRIAALDPAKKVGSARVLGQPGPMQPSFCTVAPLTFCEARGATRDRGSYVWADAKYQKEGLMKYVNKRFWHASDKTDAKFGPGNHSKVMFVSQGDDNATGLVLIGSDNMYPSPLSEFNFVIEGEDAIALFRQQYWDRLWGYSARLGFTVKPDGSID